MNNVVMSYLARLQNYTKMLLLKNVVSFDNYSRSMLGISFYLLLSYAVPSRSHNDTRMKGSLHLSPRHLIPG